MTTPAFGEVKDHVRAEMLAVALTRRLGVPVTIEPARSYEEVVAALENGDVDAAWGTAELCNRFEQDAHAVLRAVRSGTCAYHAALICRADEPLSLDSLEGTSAAWVTKWSTAGYLLPRSHLERNGINVDNTFASQREYGTYRRALCAVLDGEADVASVYCTQADDRAVRATLSHHVGRRESELRAFAFSQAVPSDGVIVTRRMPQELADRFIDALVGLGLGGAGLLPHLGLFDTEGFALDGHVTTPEEVAQRVGLCSGLLMIEVAADATCQRIWSQSGLIQDRSAAHFVGRQLADVLGADAAAPVSMLVSDAFRNRSGGRVDFHIGSDDDVRWYTAEMSVSPRTFEPGGTAALIIRDVSVARTLEAELFHLASFPLLNAQPVVEIDRDGALRYANRAAHHHFPALLSQGVDHPLIAAMLAASRSSQKRTRGFLRDIEVNGRAFRICFASAVDAEFIRAFVVDVSEPLPRTATPSAGIRPDVKPS